MMGGGEAVKLSDGGGEVVKLSDGGGGEGGEMK